MFNKDYVYILSMPVYRVLLVKTGLKDTYLTASV